MIKTGLRFFDKTGGFEEKGIILIEGPTGIGKKMLAYQLINNWIKKKKNIILINADNTDERIIRIFKTYFKTNIFKYPNFIIINTYETKIPLKKIEETVKEIKLKNEIVVFDSLTGYLFNTEQTPFQKKQRQKIETKTVERIINYHKKNEKISVIIINNNLISKKTIEKLEKAARTVIKLNFKEDKEELKREMKLEKGKIKEKKKFLITNLGIRV